MTDQELREEIKKAQGGSVTARNVVLVACQPMIRTIVTKFAKSIGREDLIEDMCQQALFGDNGAGGVARAIQHYRAGAKDTFSAFATKDIIAACRDLTLPSMITPGQARNRSRKTRADRKRVHGKAMTAALAAGQVFEGSVSELVERRGGGKRLEEHNLNEDYDILGSLDGANVQEDHLVDMIDVDEQKAKFEAAIDSLELEERYVLHALAGTHGSPSTHQQIARQLGIHRLKVHKIVKRAIKKLKANPLCQVTKIP